MIKTKKGVCGGAQLPLARAQAFITTATFLDWSLIKVGPKIYESVIAFSLMDTDLT